MPTGIPKDPDATRRRKAEATRASWNNPETRARRAEGTKTSWTDASVRAKRAKGISIARTGAVMPEDTRRKISAKLTGRPANFSPEALKRIGDNGRKQVAEQRGIFAPGSRKPHSRETIQKIADRNRGRGCTEEFRASQSEITKRKWADPEYRAKVLAARKGRPNGLEQSVIPLLTPLGFRYTGGGSHWVHDAAGSHNPDFKLTGQRIVIEVWGDYWHRDDDPAALVAWYREHGYECLILWENGITPETVASAVGTWLLSLN